MLKLLRNLLVMRTLNKALIHMLRKNHEVILGSLANRKSPIPVQNIRGGVMVNDACTVVQ